MMKFFLRALFAAWIVSNTSRAAEYTWDFSETPEGQLPTNCFSILGGEGKPGAWKVVTDEYPLPLAAMTPGGRSTAPKSVIAQTAVDPTDEHCPMLQMGTNTYQDFKFTTHFKIVDGAVEQMAGVAFRMQDTKNYYYVRASALSGTFYFYKIVKGERSLPTGNEVKFSKGEWHELTIECAGAKINIQIDGRQVIPTLTDLTFSSGKIALWTKSDAVSYFADCHISYTPKVSFAESLVEETMKVHKSLVGVEILTVDGETKKSRIIACRGPSKVGDTGESTDYKCFTDGNTYFRKEGKIDFVTLPLRDRNGETVGVARCLIKRPTLLQERESAQLQAREIVAWMEKRVSTVDSLY